MNKIQRIPVGLLALLDARGTGEYPSQLEPSVRAGLDMSPFYATSVADTDVDGFNTGASGVTAEITVPQDEFWWLMYAIALARVDGVLTTMIESRLELQVAAGTAGLLPVATNLYQRGDNSVLPDNWVCPAAFFAPYPIPLRGGARVRAQANFSGGASADIAVQAVFGRSRP